MKNLDLILKVHIFAKAFVGVFANIVKGMKKTTIMKGILGAIILVAVFWVGLEDPSGVEGTSFFVEKGIALVVILAASLKYRDYESRK